MSEIDLDLLAMAAQWHSVHVRALAELKESVVQTTEANGKVQKPEVAIAKTAAGIVRSVLSEFGVGPGSRTKVDALPEEEPADPFERFRAKRGIEKFLA